MTSSEPMTTSRPQTSLKELYLPRNRHWRYISSFHGPWLQLPPEVLQVLAHQNYSMPQPRLIDPAVFFDLVKIRRFVDEAIEDAVRASTGLTSKQSNGSLGRMDPHGGGGSGSRMSKERTHKVRQKAVKLLDQAYALDEVATSVVTMQSSSSLEEVAQHVLKRDKNDTEAKYVHFFHEKIPSRMMEQYTPLGPLDEVLSALPMEKQAAARRTRGLTQIFKREYDGAIADFTLALRITREINQRHKPGANQLVLARQFKEEQESWNKSGRDWRSIPQLKDEEQPKGLEQQLLFNRAGVYLTLACQSVPAALDGLKEHQNKTQSPTDGELSQAEKHAHHARLEARKRVKTCAKRALKDYLGFLEFLDYTPGLPVEITDEMLRRVQEVQGKRSQSSLPRQHMLENGESRCGGSSPVNGALIRRPTQSTTNGSKLEWGADGWPQFPQIKKYAASALFAERPPPDLPEFPNPDADGNAHSADGQNPFALVLKEAVTYHPLLTEALHSLLLSHALVQTSPTEILRHAHNVARLSRISNGYPLFQAARSPARADWIEVIRRTNNWLGLSKPWQQLCQPALSTQQQSSSSSSSALQRTSASTASDNESPTAPKKKANETPDQRAQRIKQRAIADALGDERVVDDDSFQRAVQARIQRAYDDEDGVSSPLSNRPIFNTTASASVPNGKDTPTQSSSSSGGTNDDVKEYPISTDRADAVANWVREAPLNMGAGGGKRKKTGAGRKKGGITGTPSTPGTPGSTGFTVSTAAGGGGGQTVAGANADAGVERDMRGLGLGLDIGKQHGERESEIDEEVD